MLPQSPPSLPGDKLPVFTVLTDTAALMLAHGPLLVTITLPAAVMMLGATVAEAAGASGFVQQVFFILSLWLGVGATVQQVRLGAFGPAGVPDPKNDPFRIGRREVMVFLAMLAVLALPLGMTHIAAMQANTGTGASSLVLLAAAPLILLLGMRLFVILAACACDHPHPVRAGWQYGQGQSWRLAGLALCISLGFMLLLSVLMAFAIGFAPKAAEGGAAQIGATIAQCLLTLVQLAVTAFANLAWGVTLRRLIAIKPHRVDTEV